MDDFSEGSKRGGDDSQRETRNREHGGGTVDRRLETLFQTQKEMSWLRWSRH